ncbi:MAG: phenylalanine--tRNA ligase subunit beta [Atribacterota bacterium]|nr:phenylalanine--tRNA ligase subunit beta [Atribacterota bacterium]
MQVSYNLLKEYVDIELNPDELSYRLSMNGIVAEHSKPIFKNTENVVVGKIKNIETYKGNEILKICLVDIGSEEIEVLCGAKNVQIGDNIPFAKEGAVLPGLGEITAKKFHDFYSRGMICSASELGLEKSKSPGVLVLDEQFPLGKDLSLLPGICDDVIFDFEIFSNRPDLMSIIGIAREISAFSGKSLKIPDFSIFEIKRQTKNEICVKISDYDLCPRYTGRIITNIKIKESPFWLRWRLFLLGIRPINNVVDVTNYIMMETGQPLHAFDLDYIDGRQIIIRRANQNEKFTTLDGVERILTKENLVIADKEKAIALAGLMGGENSEIKDITKDVFLESAYFDPVNNRKTSKYFSLRTDASNRFEKGVDPKGQLYALNRATEMINKIAGGDIFSGLIDEHREKIHKNKVISLNSDKIGKILGINVVKNKEDMQKNVIDVLRRLEFTEIKIMNNEITAIPPSFRIDIEKDIDIIEEIAKIYGYENIPSTLFKNTVMQKVETDEQKTLNKTKNILVSCGLHQTINYSIINQKFFDWLQIPEKYYLRETIQLANPLIQDQTIMRTTLIPGLLKTVQWNANHRVEKIKLFEIGKVFCPKNKEQLNNDQLPDEKIMISAVITRFDRGNIWEKREKWDYYYLKGILESIFEYFGLIEKTSFEQGDFPSFEGKQNALIRIGKVDIGIIGKIKNEITEYLDIPGEVYQFEIDFNKLFSVINEFLKYKTLPKYPFVQRDLSLVVSDIIPTSEISNIIYNVDRNIIKKVELFDVFKGSQIKDNHKSVAFSIVFQSEKCTLTDEEVDNLIEEIKSQLNRYFMVELRQ